MERAIGIVAEVFSVISIIGHVFQHYLHKTQDRITLGFLHGTKPAVEAGASGHSMPEKYWAGVLVQFNDMISRLQPPRKTK
jgi:hypothetical protein